MKTKKRKLPKIDDQADNNVMHGDRFGKTDGFTGEPLDVSSES